MAPSVLATYTVHCSTMSIITFDSDSKVTNQKVTTPDPSSYTAAPTTPQRDAPPQVYNRPDIISFSPEDLSM